MEENRQIRFLVPPFILLLGFLLGFAVELYEPPDFLSQVEDKSLAAIIGLIVAGGVGVIASGFIIGSISIWFIRLILGPDYEVLLDDNTIKDMMRAIGAKQIRPPERNLYPGAIFDHWLLYEKAPGLHKWLGRRWNMFNVSAHSCTAVALSVLAGLVRQDYLNDRFFWIWWVPHVIAFLLFFCGARRAHADAMEMLKFICEQGLSLRLGIILKKRVSRKGV